MKQLVLTCVVVFVLLQAGFGCTVVVTPAQVARTFTIELTYAEKPLAMQVSISEARSGELVRKLETDAHGRAEIHDLKPGTYSVVSPVSDGMVEVLPQGGVEVLHVVARFDHAPINVARVNATVTDITGAVIPKAVVALEAIDDSHSPVAAGTTDAAGSISLDAPPGEYLLRVGSPGFHTAVVPLKITENGWSGFKLAMRVGSCPGGPAVPLSIEPKQ